MTAPALAVRQGGGLPARRAMLRWARRMLRREWRSQALLIALLLTAVAATVCGASVLANLPPPVEPTFGTAKVVFVLKGSAPALAADVASLRGANGTMDVVGHTSEQAPGLALPVDYRAQSLGGAFTGGLLAIHRGRYPTGTGEAAITSGLARLLGLRPGGTITLDGHARAIVGVAENPADLTDDFVLVAPGAGPAPTDVSVFLGPGARNPGGLHTLDEQRGLGADHNQLAIATLILAAATILLLLVAFVAAAGFAVLAHRRLRQLGMLAAVGATAAQVRLVMTATGLLVGAVGAAAGTATGLLLWPPAAAWTETVARHRIDRLGVPWPTIAGVVLLAVLMTTVAAWWPSRAVSRLPVTLALSGRPPARRSTRRPAILAVLFLAAGLTCLAVAEKKHPPLVVAGVVATALAILFAAPLAVRVLAAAAGRAPVAIRLALRDLGRHQARSGAAVAALSLALGIPVAIVLVTTGLQATPATGNLSDRQLLVRLTQPDQPPGLIPARTDAQLRTLTAQIGKLAAGIPQSVVVPLDMAYDPAVQKPGSASRRAQELERPGGPHGDTGVDTYVATPELLRLLGADPAGIPASADVVTGETAPLTALNPLRDGPRYETWPTTRIKGSAYTSVPDSLLTDGALARHRLDRIRAGWLLQAPGPLTTTQLADARGIAVAAGFTIEARDAQGGIRATRAVATGAGLLLALAVLAMTAGLIRAEAAADLRTLTAAGATPGVRRVLSAATAGALALLGALLGTAGAGLGLLAVYRHDLGVFGRVPPAYVLVVLLGVPLAAAAGGWLLAGREPRAIARRLAD